MSKLTIVEGNSNDKDNVRVIMVKGEKGDTGDPTKLSQLENDTGFITAEEANLQNYYTKGEIDTTVATLNDTIDEKADTTEIQNQIDTINSTKANTSDVAITYATKTEVNALASGSPLVASSTSGMTNTSRVYVNTSDGNWYYYNGSSWVIGGTYQSTGIADNSITYPKINFEGILSNYETINIDNFSLGYSETTEHYNLTKQTNYGYVIHCFDVTNFYDMGISKIPITVRGGNFVRIYRTSKSIEEIQSITANNTQVVGLIDTTDTEVNTDIEIAQVSKTVIVYTGRYTQPEILIGKEIKELSNNLILNRNIKTGTIETDKTNFALKKDNLPCTILRKITLTAHATQTTLFKLTKNTDQSHNQTSYMIDVSSYVATGKRSIVINIKGSDLTFIRIGRSTATIEDVENLAVNSSINISKIYENSNITENEYNIAIDLLETNKSVFIYTGLDTNPEIKVTNGQYSFVNDKDNDWISISSYPKCDNDTSDSERIQRAFNENKNKTIFFPYGEYQIATTINGTDISMKCDNQAHFIGSTGNHFMFVISYDNTDHRHYSIENGWFDGNYDSSCIKVQGGHNVTLKDCMFTNPWHYGVYVGVINGISTSKYYVDNCTVRGTEDTDTDNIAFRIEGSDHHFVDCTVSNIKTAFDIAGGGSDRFVRCHSWIAKDSLIDISTGFNINAGGCTFLDCYLDTLKVGFNIGANAQFFMCNGYNNLTYGMTGETYFKKDNSSVKALIVGGYIKNNRGTIFNDDTNITKIGFDVV